MANKVATPGTGLRGPIYVLDDDGDVQVTLQAGTTDLPTAVDDDSGGTADTTDYTIAAIDETITGVDGTGDNAASQTEVQTQFAAINDNFATIASLLDAILERLQ